MIEDVPVVVYCATCDGERTLESIQRFCCPTCGALTPDVVNGKQLELVGLEITEASAAAEVVETSNSIEQRAGIAL